MNKVFHNQDLNKIEYLDQRFYRFGKDEYFPSVTTILEVFPKGFGFDQWLKDVGENANNIRDRAAATGGKIHDTIERLLNFEAVTWASAEGTAKYTFEEWKIVARFVAFFTGVTMEIIATETQVYSEQYKFAGTIDLVCSLNGLIYLIDFKTTNFLSPSAELQIAAYAMAWNELVEKQGQKAFRIDRTAILWLKAATRGPQPKKIQGDGWQLKDDFGRPYEKAFETFKHVQAIWNEVNPEPKPKNLTFPDTFTLRAPTNENDLQHDAIKKDL